MLYKIRLVVVYLSIFVTLLFVNSPVWGKDSWGPYSCTYIESKTGSHHVLLCEIWPALFHKVVVSVYGVSTPTVERSKCADELQLALRALEVASERLSSGKAIQVYVMGFDERGRTLASVYVDSNPLRNHLIAEGVGKWWIPGKPEVDWCNAETP